MECFHLLRKFLSYCAGQTGVAPVLSCAARKEVWRIEAKVMSCCDGVRDHRNVPNSVKKGIYYPNLTVSLLVLRLAEAGARGFL